MTLRCLTRLTKSPPTLTNAWIVSGRDFPEVDVRGVCRHLSSQFPVRKWLRARSRTSPNTPERPQQRLFVCANHPRGMFGSFLILACLLWTCIQAYSSMAPLLSLGPRRASFGDLVEIEDPPVQTIKRIFVFGVGRRPGVQNEANMYLECEKSRISDETLKLFSLIRISFDRRSRIQQYLGET